MEIRTIELIALNRRCVSSLSNCSQREPQSVCAFLRVYTTILEIPSFHSFTIKYQKIDHRGQVLEKIQG